MGMKMFQLFSLFLYNIQYITREVVKMYVVMNELYVPIEGKAEMIKRFSQSAEKMKKVSGCLEYMFLDHEAQTGKQVVFTKWESKEAYRAWVEGDAFRKAHKEKQDDGKGSPAGGNELNAYSVIYHT